MLIRKLTLISLTLCSCGVLEKQPPQDPPNPSVQELIKKPLPPEKAEELLSEAGSNWLYGQGVGETALTAGAIFAFPPYAIYVVGNGVLSMAGYKQIRISDILPEEEKNAWNEAYDTVTSGPGRFTAAVAGREYRTKEVAKERIQQILKDKEPL